MSEAHEGDAENQDQVNEPETVEVVEQYSDELNRNDEDYRMFGKFNCDCGRFWYSANTWDGYGQSCNGCGRYVYPRYRTRLQQGLGRTGENRIPHDQSKCEKCREIGANCQKVYSSRKNKVRNQHVARRRFRRGRRGGRGAPRGSSNNPDQENRRPSRYRRVSRFRGASRGQYDDQEIDSQARGSRYTRRPRGDTFRGQYDDQEVDSQTRGSRLTRRPRGYPRRPRRQIRRPRGGFD